MDWDRAIERNREALKRIVASLIALAGLGCRGQFTFFPHEGAAPRSAALAEKSKLSPTPTLPRHLHRAVLRLLRPAEAAVRRLVIVAARDVIAPPPAPPRHRKPKPKSAFLRGGVGTGIILPPNAPHPEVRGGPELRACRGVEGEPQRTPAQRTLCLPLTDSLPRWRTPRRPAASGIPRISFPGFSTPFPVPVRRLAAPDDPVDATRLGLRLAALSSALDDLPKHARRFARWRSRVAAGAQNKGTRDAGRIRRLSPLRPGRPPGQSAVASRRPPHEVHEALSDLQYFAFKALERADTS